MVKRKIADWIYRFWYKNHTHLWVYESEYGAWMSKHIKVKCKLCGKITTEAELLNQNPDETFRAI